MPVRRPMRLPFPLSALLGLAVALAPLAAAAQGADPFPAFKRAFEKLFDRGTIPLEILRDSGAVDLTDCGHGSLRLESSGQEIDPEDEPLADLAYEVVRLGRLCRRLEYPESVWGPVLADLERSGKENFSRARGGYLERLSQALNGYRRKVGSRSLAITVVEGCGEEP